MKKGKRQRGANCKEKAQTDLKQQFFINVLLEYSNTK